MKSEEEIRERLKELESDERLTEYDDANVEINPVLALHQVSGEAKIGMLKWVLEE